MRKVWISTIVTLFLLALARPAQAQSPEFGIQAGFVAARLSISGTGSFETNADLGPAGGIFLRFELSPTVHLQPEALFAFRRFSSSELPMNLEVDARVIDLPLLFRKSFGNRVRPVLFAGPQLTLIPRVNQTFGQTESDISADIRNLDVAMVTGAGVEASAGRGAFVLDVRVVLGVRNLNADSGATMKSRAVMALAGWRF